MSKNKVGKSAVLATAVALALASTALMAEEAKEARNNFV